MLDLIKLKPEIERICRLLPVKRLGFFGSAVTRDFLPNSDVDVLVVFDADESIDLFDKYFELKERLESIFEREVDLVVDKPFKNPVFRESVEKTRTVIYERCDTEKPDRYNSGRRGNPAFSANPRVFMYLVGLG